MTNDEQKRAHGNFAMKYLFSPLENLFRYSFSVWKRYKAKKRVKRISNIFHNVAQYMCYYTSFAVVYCKRWRIKCGSNSGFMNFKWVCTHFSNCMAHLKYIDPCAQCWLVLYLGGSELFLIFSCSRRRCYTVPIRNENSPWKRTMRMNGKRKRMNGNDKSVRIYSVTEGRKKRNEREIFQSPSLFSPLLFCFWLVYFSVSANFAHVSQTFVYLFFFFLSLLKIAV